MTALISLEEAQAWLEITKLSLPSLDLDLLESIQEEVIIRIASTYDTSSWLTPATTPRLVRVAIAKMYCAWVYDRQYSENLSAGSSAYATRLTANAEMLITGIIDGTIELPTIPSLTSGSPSFYPTDASSALEPTIEDPSLGPAKFSMGTVF